MVRKLPIYINIILLLLLLICKPCSAIISKPNGSSDSLEVKLILAPDSLKINLLNRLAEKHLESDPLKAIKTADAAFKLAEQSNDHSEQVKSLIILGQANRMLLSDFEKALEYCFKALKIAEENRLKSEEAISLSAIADIYSEVGNSYKAIEYYMQSLIIHQELHDEEGLINTNNALGRVYLRLETPKKALQYHKAALAMSKKTGVKKLEANTIHHIGEAVKRDGKPKEAINYQKQALAIRKSIKDEAGIAQSYTALGELYLSEEDTDRALEYQLLGIKSKKKLKDNKGLALSYNNIGAIFIQTKEYERAIKNIEVALEYGVQEKGKKQIRDSYELLYSCYSSLEDYAMALEYKDLFIAISEFIYSEESERKLAEMQTKYEIDKKENEIEILKRDQLLQEYKLESQATVRNLLILGLAMIAIIACLIYYSYWVKKRSNIDLTCRNAEINDQNRKLEELNATKDKFFSIISHDLKGPLNSLTSFSSLLINHTAHLSKEEIQMLAKDLDKSVKGLFSLLENLLEWSRSQSGNIELKPESLDLNDLINQSKHLLSKTAESKNIEIQTTEYYNISVHADRNSVSTVIRNLMSNALKFTPEGGQVRIEATESSNMVMISVHDNGVGMSEEVMDKLFRIDKKHTTKGTANEKGTGLGLILCKEFVEKNGGTIAVESREGEGSIFSFTLPKARATEFQAGLAS